jgi:hypothetical protein
MTLVVEQDEPSDPGDVGLLRAVRRLPDAAAKKKKLEKVTSSSKWKKLSQQVKLDRAEVDRLTRALDKLEQREGARALSSCV